MTVVLLDFTSILSVSDAIVTCLDLWVILVTKSLVSVSAEITLKAFSVTVVKKAIIGSHAVLPATVILLVLYGSLVNLWEDVALELPSLTNSVNVKRGSWEISVTLASLAIGTLIQTMHLVAENVVVTKLVQLVASTSVMS